MTSNLRLPNQHGIEPGQDGVYHPRRRSDRRRPAKSMRGDKNGSVRSLSDETEVTELPQAGTVHVWLADIGEFDGMAAAPASEELRAQRFLRQDDRRRFLGGRALARGVLGGYLGCPPTEVTFALADSGKPYMCPRSGADLRFNISHSGSVVALAVSVGVEVGVDVETEPPSDPAGLAPMVLSTQELQAFESLPEALRPAAFLRCWTRKEALLKAAGTGFSGDPRMLTVGCGADPTDPVAMPDSVVRFAVRDIAVTAGASGSVALAAAAMAVETRRHVPASCLPRTMPPASSLI
jgi:4'-phosphopantetheinyl transferase